MVREAAIVRAWLSDEPSPTPVWMSGMSSCTAAISLCHVGGAPTSALIRRGNDYHGNFSHISFVHGDPAWKESKIVEAQSEVGVVASTLERQLLIIGDI